LAKQIHYLVLTAACSQSVFQLDFHGSSGEVSPWQGRISHYLHDASTNLGYRSDCKRGRDDPHQKLSDSALFLQNCFQQLKMVLAEWKLFPTAGILFPVFGNSLQLLDLVPILEKERKKNRSM
jgi:hypothetical protein